VKNPLARLAGWFARRRPAPGRFSLGRKSNLHGFLAVAPAPPWREFLLYVPRGIEAIRRPPLVVWIHGCRQEPEAFASGTRIARFADERGFVVLLPRQSRMANSERCWNWFDRRTAAGNGETAIVAAQTVEVIEKLGIDPARVYLAGLSSGATLAATLALRKPELFAAAALHSGVPCGAAFDAHDAGRVMAAGPRDSRTDALAAEARAAAGPKARMPALVIHGSADETVAPVNSTYLVRQFVLFNGGDLPPGAALPPTLTRAGQPHAAGHVMSEYYAGRRLAARLITIPGLGHAWSGGDPALEFFDDRRLDATALVCDFFSSHARPAAAR
jgi:poly(hydroxyalkanoate) depolymerase family esterase